MTADSAIPESKPFTWCQCLRLCVPALVVGAILRIWFLAAIPEGFYGADSNSYFDTTTELWLHHHFKVSDKRRWLYPIMLAPTPFIPPSPARVIPVVQHAIGLVTILGLGWIVGQLTRLRVLWVPLVTTLYAVWPRTLWYEHEIVAESVFLSSIVLMVALAFPIGSLKNPRRLCWFLLAAALVIAIKPHGRGIWVAALLAAALITRNPLKWDWKSWGAVGLGVLVLATSGSSSQGNWLLLSSSLPLVQTEGAKWAEYRELLRPLVEETRSHGLGYAWMQGRYKKRLSSSKPEAVHPQWAELTKDKRKFSQVCSSLAREGILAHPVTFAQLTMMKSLIALRDENDQDDFVPARFWASQATRNDSRWADDPREMELVYQMNAEQYAALTAERATRNFGAVPLLGWVARVFAVIEAGYDDVGRKFTLRPHWMGFLVLLGLVVCLLPRRFAATSVLWLPVGCYFATVFAVGDRLPRYVQPVEWVGWVLVVVGLDVLLMRVLPYRHPERSGAESKDL